MVPNESRGFLTVAILWFAAGVLRFADCAVVNAVASLTHRRTCVLSVAVLTVNEIALCAVRSLICVAQPRRLRSCSFVRVVQQAAQKPATIAYLTRAPRVNVDYADAAVAPSHDTRIPSISAFFYCIIISTAFGAAATSSRGGKHRSIYLRIIRSRWRIACIDALWYASLHCFSSALLESWRGVISSSPSIC